MFNVVQVFRIFLLFFNIYERVTEFRDILQQTHIFYAMYRKKCNWKNSEYICFQTIAINSLSSYIFYRVKFDETGRDQVEINLPF